MEKEKTYTRQEIAKHYNICVNVLKYREKILGIKPIFRKHKSKAKLYTYNQIELIINFKPYEKSKEPKIPKVIYHTQTFHIYQSKMNYNM